MTIEKTKTLLTKYNITESVVGFGGFEVATSPQLKEFQLGYSVGVNGESLCGEEKGDWKKSWLVIGRDTLVGDPIIVDIETDKLVVYTAPHGEGVWELSDVSDSLDQFLKALEYLNKYFSENGQPTDPDEIEELCNELIDITGEDDYWELVCENLEDL